MFSHQPKIKTYLFILASVTLGTFIYLSALCLIAQSFYRSHINASQSCHATTKAETNGTPSSTSDNTCCFGSFISLASAFLEFFHQFIPLVVISSILFFLLADYIKELIFLEIPFQLRLTELVVQRK